MLSNPELHPLLHPLCPMPPQQQRIRISQIMLHPHPVFAVSHPHPQFVAAKSLMLKSSKGFLFTLHHMTVCLSKLPVL